MRIFLFVLGISACQCFAQADYESKFLGKVNEIKSLKLFNNGIVLSRDTLSYGSTYPAWSSELTFLVKDAVMYKGATYVAISDSQSKYPAISPNEWKLIRGRHPYLFLRDSAKTDDLRSLLKSDHTFIKSYAFGALSFRKEDGLFEVVIDNLSDTRSIKQFTGDYGFEVHPADLMIQYQLSNFSKNQKETLRKLISTKFKHLERALELLKESSNDQ